MIYAVAVAICLNTTPVARCNQHSALDWISDIPEVDGPTLCMKAGISEATTRGLFDGVKTYPKVFCTPGGRSIVPDVPKNSA